MAPRQRGRPARAGARPDVHAQGGRRARGAGAQAPADAVARGRGRRRRARGRCRATAGDAPWVWRRPTISTYNSYAASLVADHALRLGLDPSARLLGEAAPWQLAHEAVGRGGLGRRPRHRRGDVDGHRGRPDALRRARRAPGSRPRRGRHRGHRRRRSWPTPSGTTGGEPSTRGQATRSGRSASARPCCSSSSPSTGERKRAADAIDFGDQVALAARLALDVPEVGAGERTRFRVVLLDEYQDTSYAQLTLLGALFGDGHPVTAVGDPHQSIYGWRGASSATLDRFPAHFVHPEPPLVLPLSTSWRNDTASSPSPTSSPDRSARSTRVPVPSSPHGPGGSRSRRQGTSHHDRGRGCCTSPPGSSTGAQGRAVARQQCCAASVPDGAAAAASSPSDPRTIDSWSLVSSRQTAAGPVRPARLGEVPQGRRRPGSAPRTGSCHGRRPRSGPAARVRSRPERGRNPSNDQRGPATPDPATAASTADAPGTGTTVPPSAAQAATSSPPGSLTDGVPASVTSARSAPPRRCSSSAVVRAASLWAW